MRRHNKRTFAYQLNSNAIRTTSNIKVTTTTTTSSVEVTCFVSRASARALAFVTKIAKSNLIRSRVCALFSAKAIHFACKLSKVGTTNYAILSNEIQVVFCIYWKCFATHFVQTSKNQIAHKPFVRATRRVWWVWTLTIEHHIMFNMCRCQRI